MRADHELVPPVPSREGTGSTGTEVALVAHAGDCPPITNSVTESLSLM